MRPALFLLEAENRRAPDGACRWWSAGGSPRPTAMGSCHERHSLRPTTRFRADFKCGNCPHLRATFIQRLARETAVAAFCHEVLGEIVRPRQRPGRKRTVSTASPIVETAVTAAPATAQKLRPHSRRPLTPKLPTLGPRDRAAHGLPKSAWWPTQAAPAKRPSERRTRDPLWSEQPPPSDYGRRHRQRAI